MLFNTKIVIAVRSDLAPWQKMNVTAFLSGGIAASYPECVGDPYEDASDTTYLRLIGQPILIYGGESNELTRTLDRALARGVRLAIYTEDMFSTYDDTANREVVRCVPREQLNLAGIAFRAERKIVDKIVDRLKLHQ
jgi:hypothetical protein